MTNDNWQRLYEDFDTHTLTTATGRRRSATGCCDCTHWRWRSSTKGSRRQAPELFDLAMELEDEAFTMLEAISKLHETLSALVELRPESLDEEATTRIDGAADPAAGSSPGSIGATQPPSLLAVC